MWQLNMVACLVIAFGCFAWALWKTMDAEKQKRGNA